VGFDAGVDAAGTVPAERSPAEEPTAAPAFVGEAEAAASLPQAPPAGSDIDPAERTPRSFHLSRRLLERARAAAFWLGRQPDRKEATNVSELVERALASEVERLEREYNGGVPFPAVLGRMRTGPGASGAERIRRAQRARRRPS
jgi:hypothetical protein